MEMQELEITIDREGRVQVLSRGTKGEGCLALSQNIEQAVGTVEDRHYTGEYYEQPVTLTEKQYVNR